MDADIKSLVQQIVVAAMEVSAEGNYHVFVDYMGHVGAVDGYYAEAGSIYSINRLGPIYITGDLATGPMAPDPVIELAKVRDQIEALKEAI